MATDRLTRQELSWLLAQEARAAASLLRKGVSGLRVETAPVITDVSTTLDVLDDAVKTLATLQTGGAAHSRRGRIDVAALLLELTPHASINLATGSGTEIFADEAELRRMLQVLLSVGAPAGEGGSAIQVRRHEDAIRVEVSLGPDSSGASSMEQAWLHRMAVRHGGQLTLEGNTVTLELPAGGEQREVEELRRELAAAQEQGEMYAREIAAMFSRPDDSPQPPSVTHQGPSLTAFCKALVAGLRPDVQALREGVDESLAPRAQAIASSLDLLDRFAHVSPARSELDAGRALREAGEAHAVRADRRGVRLEVVPASLSFSTSPSALALLLDLLIAHAIDSSPADGQVRVAFERTDRPTLCVDDSGPALTHEARRALLALDTDPGSLGRPRGPHLALASALVAPLGASLILDESPSGGLRTRVVFLSSPRLSPGPGYTLVAR